MANHAHSTTAPARRLLPPAANRAAPARDARGRFVRRHELPPEPLLAAADAAESTTPAASAAKGLSPETAPESTTSPRPSDPLPSADEALDDMARELGRQGVPHEPLLSAVGTTSSRNAASGLGRKTALEGMGTTTVPVCVTHTADPVSMMDTPVVVVTTTTLRCHDGNEGMVMMTMPVCVAQTADPAFAAVRAFDRVVAEWDAAFAEFLGIMDALDPDGRRCWDDPQAVARTVLGPVAGSTVAALDRLLRRMEALDAGHEAAEARLLSTRAASEIGAAALRAAVRRYARRPFGWRAEETIMLQRLAA